MTEICRFVFFLPALLVEHRQYVSQIIPAKSFLGSRTQRTHNNHHMNTRELVLQLAVFSVLDSLIYRKLTTERENERQGWVFAPLHERATTTLYHG